jgi:hypothetical protein
MLATFVAVVAVVVGFTLAPDLFPHGDLSRLQQDREVYPEGVPDDQLVTMGLKSDVEAASSSRNNVSSHDATSRSSKDYEIGAASSDVEITPRDRSKESLKPKKSHTYGTH